MARGSRRDRERVEDGRCHIIKIGEEATNIGSKSRYSRSLRNLPCFPRLWLFDMKVHLANDRPFFRQGEHKSFFQLLDGIVLRHVGSRSCSTDLDAVYRHDAVDSVAWVSHQALACEAEEEIGIARQRCARVSSRANSILDVVCCIFDTEVIEYDFPEVLSTQNGERPAKVLGQIEDDGLAQL